MKNKAKCIQEIRNMRKQMEKSGIENGLTDERTIYISEQLDHIITKCSKHQIKQLTNQ